MFCRNCGKEITDGTAFCPECGAAQNGTTQNASQEPPTISNAAYSNPTNQSEVKKVPYNTMCIVGLVVSGISLLLNFFGIVGIAGTILSVLGLMDCKKKNENGKALAIIGIVIGVFSIIYGLVAIMSL